MNSTISTRFLILISISLSSLLIVGQSSAEQLTTVEKALKKVYKESTNVEKNSVELSSAQQSAIEERSGILFGESHSSMVTVYVIFQGEKVVGYAFEDSVLGKWGQIHYLAALDENGTVREIVILDYSEIRGRPIAKRRFLRQYRNKTREDPVLLRRDIDGVTGATISSRSLTDGIRKLLHVFPEIKSGLDLKINLKED